MLHQNLRHLSTFSGGDFISENVGLVSEMHSAARVLISAAARNVYPSGRNWPYFLLFSMINTGSKVGAQFLKGRYSGHGFEAIGMDIAFATLISLGQAYTDMRWMSGFDNFARRFRHRLPQGFFPNFHGELDLALVPHDHLRLSRFNIDYPGEFNHPYLVRRPISRFSELIPILVWDFAWAMGVPYFYEYLEQATSFKAIEHTGIDHNLFHQILLGTIVYQSARIIITSLGKKAGGEGYLFGRHIGANLSSMILNSLPTFQ